MSNDVTSTASGRKQLMRRDAIALRRTVSDAERTAAGKKLVKQVAMSLTGQTTNSDRNSAKAFTVNLNQTAGSMQRRQHTLRIIPAGTAAAYISMGSEIPTIPLLECLHEHERRVLVPRLGSGHDIGWSEYDGREGLHTMPRTAAGRIRPQEPFGKTLAAEAIEDASIVLVPAFAIDLDGNRLGRGGGWYDRVLRLCRSDAVKIGVCWDWELMNVHEAIPHEAHDIPVDAAATPERFLWLGRR
jgi:5-formyltetrahydrofolate cyclo-ligase